MKIANPELAEKVKQDMLNWSNEKTVDAEIVDADGKTYERPRFEKLKEGELQHKGLKDWHQEGNISDTSLIPKDK
jgi:hypothetical protein